MAFGYGLEWGANGRLIRRPSAAVSAAATGLTAPEATLGAAGLHAAATEDAANIAAGNVRGTGSLTKYRPTEGWSTPGPGAPDLNNRNGGPPPNLADASLGAPTSYGGGHPIDESGNPQPGFQPSVGVIRGNKQTFAADTGGTQLSEFATPQQAGQAVNRAKDIGEYVPPKGPELQMAADLTAQRPDIVAAAKLHDAQAAAAQVPVEEAARTRQVQDFTKQWQGTYGQYDKNGVYQKPTEPGVAQDLAAATEVARTHGPEAGMSHYSDSVKVRQFTPLFTPENMAGFRSTLPPDQQNNPVYSDQYLNALKQHPQAWREVALAMGPKLQSLQGLQNAQQPSIGSRLWTQEGPTMGP